MDCDDRDYHRERARSELEWADRAAKDAAAAAHLRLSALHMERLRMLDEHCAGATAGN